MLKFAREMKIAVTGYAPMGCGGRPEVCLGSSSYHKDNGIQTIDYEDRVLDNTILVEIGKKYGKTAAQVCIRFGIQRGYVVIPKSVNLEHVTENSQVFDFELSEVDMAALYKMNKN